MTKLDLEIQTPSLLLLSILLLAPFATGCQTGETEKPPETTAAPETEAPASSAGDRAGDDVAYEPAYPSEVSDEGLSEEDAEQQQATHDHGDEEHSHQGGEVHSHDDEEPAHGEANHGGDDHAHGDEEHSHDDGSDEDHGHDH